MNKTPYELFKGRKPNIMHLRVFGCKYYAHNNGKDALGKFDLRSDEASFLVTPDTVRHTKCLIRKPCVEESVHVLFDETYSLVETDTQDDDFELHLAKKNLLLTHEEGKYPEEGSGPRAAVSYTHLTLPTNREV